MLCLYSELCFSWEPSFPSRSPWPKRAQTGWGLSESPHHFFKGTCERKRIRTKPRPAQLSFSSSGQTPRTEDSMHTGPTAHLLPKTGGPGPPSTDSGEDLSGYSAVLKKNPNMNMLFGKNYRHKAPNVRFYHWTLLVNLRIHWPACWQMSDIVQETIIFLTLSFKVEYGTCVSTAYRFISVQWNCHRQSWNGMNHSGHSLYIFCVHL